MEQAFIIESIGTNGSGDTVLRIRAEFRPASEHGTSIEVNTNVLGFSRLAAAGVRVVNDVTRRK